MIRFFNVLACLALLGSAIYAYSIKYQTLFRAEQIAKMKREIGRERDAIGMQRAEWAFLTRPERLQPLADKFLDLQPTTASQIVSLSALPERAARVDTIGRKLEALGLAAPTNTPPSAASVTPQSVVTPSNGKP